jgi:hypothetical protein
MVLFERKLASNDDTSMTTLLMLRFDASHEVRPKASNTLKQ